MKCVLIIACLFLIGCNENKDFDMDLSGTYLNGSGFINDQPIYKIDLIDNGLSINVTYNDDINCTYAFFEQLNEAFYFAPIPENDFFQGELNLIYIENSELKTSGFMDTESTEICHKVEIINSFKLK